MGGGTLVEERVGRRTSFPYAVWAAFTACLLVLQFLSARVARDGGDAISSWRGTGYLFGGWSQFDGPEYLAIAREGYWYTAGVRSPVVWFPLYPLALRGVDALLGDPLLAGMIVASIGGLVAVGLYWRWLEQVGLEGDRRLVAFLVLITYPYGWYLFGVVHSDAVFLAFVIGAFLLVERGRPVWAGVVGAFATATRPTGLAVIPALVVLSLERGGVLAQLRSTASPSTLRTWVDRFRIPLRIDTERFRPIHLAPLLACLGVGSYMVYLGVRFGDPLAFQTNQRVYHPGAAPLLKKEFFGRWMEFGDNPTYAVTITGQAFVAAVGALSVPFVGRRFGWGYAVFVGALVAIPTVSTEDFMGTGRYMMAAFPLAALLGEWLARQRYRWIVVGSSATVMILLSMAFARSWYLT